MQRLQHGRRWSVFDPVDVPLLCEAVGTDFAAAYTKYEDSGLAISDYDIDVVWRAIVDSQRETGSPFILFQDNVNGVCSRYNLLFFADRLYSVPGCKLATTKAISG